MPGVDVADLGQLDFSNVTEAELLQLETSLKNRWGVIVQFPARPCAECQEWFVPTGDEPNVHRCMDCERAHTPEAC
jgi:hypothetical protein